MNQQLPMIRVLGFRTEYKKLPVKGDPMTENCDPSGYKLDRAGNVVKALQPEDFVTYAPAHSAMNTQVTERVRHLFPDPEKMGEDTDGAKLNFFMARWSQIGPAYEAFKQGREIPVNGTPLAAWPGVSPEQADVLRMSGLRTVEDVAQLNDSNLSKVKLPNMRDLRVQAKLFLENSDVAAAAEREAEKDRIIEELISQVAELRQRADNEDKPRRGGRRPKSEQEPERADNEDDEAEVDGEAA